MTIDLSKLPARPGWRPWATKYDGNVITHSARRDEHGHHLSVSSLLSIDGTRSWWAGMGNQGGAYRHTARDAMLALEAAYPALFPAEEEAGR